MAELRAEETENLRQLIKGVSLSLVSQQMPNAQQYKPFLSAAYVQSLSTSTLPLRMVEELPDSINQWLAFNARISAHSGAPAFRDRLASLGYLGTLTQRQPWYATAANLQTNQFLTIMGSPLTFLSGW